MVWKRKRLGWGFSKNRHRPKTLVGSDKNQCRSAKDTPIRISCSSVEGLGVIDISAVRSNECEETICLIQFHVDMEKLCSALNSPSGKTDAAIDKHPEICIAFPR